MTSLVYFQFISFHLSLVASASSTASIQSILFAATTLNILKNDDIVSFQAPVVWRHIVKVAIWIITPIFNKLACESNIKG